MLRHDYSWSETALGFWAALTLSVLAVASLGLRYVTEPVACWMPPHFSGNMVRYANNLCFHKEMVVRTPDPDEDYLTTHKEQFTYHQWVPFALGMAAVLCLLPHAIWRTSSGLLWLDAHALVQTVSDNQRQNAAGRHVILRDSALLLQAGLRRGNWMLTAAVAGRKVVVLLVCISQLVLAATVFSPRLFASRPETEADQKEEEEEEDAGNRIDYNASLPLPYSFVCNFEIRRVQNIDRYTVDCTLPLAQVYSKGFAFLFYLFLLLTLCCLFELLVWVGRLLIPGLRDATLKRHLAATDPDATGNSSSSGGVGGGVGGGGGSLLLPRFLDSVGLDGRLLLALTADCCGPLAAADLTNHLWVLFKSAPRAAWPHHQPPPPPPGANPPPPGGLNYPAGSNPVCLTGPPPVVPVTTHLPPAASTPAAGAGGAGAQAAPGSNPVPVGPPAPHPDTLPQSAAAVFPEGSSGKSAEAAASSGDPAAIPLISMGAGSGDPDA